MAVYKRFWIRFANEPFDLSQLHNAQKHFTVNNYNDAFLLQVRNCNLAVSVENMQNIEYLMNVVGLFRQNTYLQNKKHMLTCQVGLVVIDLITSPVVSWRGCETTPQYRGSAVILCSTTVVRGPLSSWWPAVVVC